MFKVGYVSEKTGVSVRSLRHYDKIGLLKPSGFSESGYRLYSKEDIYRLQQIVSLKQMQIPLEQIKLVLQNESMTLRQTLKVQQDYLQQQIDQYQKISHDISHILRSLSDVDNISLDLFYITMEHITMLEKYYTKEQLQKLSERDFHVDEKQGEYYANCWKNLFEGLDALRLEGVSANDAKTKPFAEQSRELVQVFTGGEKDIEASLNQMYKQEGGAAMMRSHGLDVSDELYAYYQAAVDAHR